MDTYLYRYIGRFIIIYIYIHNHVYIYKPGGPSQDPMSLTGKVFFLLYRAALLIRCVAIIHLLWGFKQVGILKPCVGVFTLNKPPGFLKFHRTSNYKIETGAQQPLFGLQMGAILYILSLDKWEFIGSPHMLWEKQWFPIDIPKENHSNDSRNRENLEIYWDNSKDIQDPWVSWKMQSIFQCCRGAPIKSTLQQLMALAT